MDEIVKAALRKWPNVPHCWDWLALDARGDWYMRDERIQAAGAFPQVKGSRIDHEKLREFIARNYMADEAGAWFFQNGPQRVYVTLEAAPYVWRIDPSGVVHTHTGVAAKPRGTWLDAEGRLFMDTDLGFGIVHTMDMNAASDMVDRGAWTPEAMAFADMPRKFGYQLQPKAP